VRLAGLRLPRVMSSSADFDAKLLLLLDALRGAAGFALVFHAWPETISQVSVWVEPLSMSEVTHLTFGGKAATLDNIPTGAEHAFVLLKTTKGRSVLTERLHDGKIVMEDMGSGQVHPFVRGKELALEADTLPKPLLRWNGPASLFESKDVVGGPSLAAMEKFARAQSIVDYDLMRSNCQHYADSVFAAVGGKSLQRLPNSISMEVANFLFPAREPVAVDLHTTPLDQVRWMSSQVGLSHGVAAGLLVLLPQPSTCSAASERRGS